MNLAILSVGSNIDPYENILQAAALLADQHNLISVSSFIWTSPEGFADQPDFLNGAFYIKTDLKLPALKEQLRDIETRLGRIRMPNKNGPRSIDLDIVVFNGRVIDPDYDQYGFVKRSVDEIFQQIRSKKWKRKIEVG